MRYGYFDNEHREYVIERVDLPASWTNYLGVEDTCVVVNHTAGGYMFYKTPEYHRITRFRANSVPMDRPGHYVYIRDNETRDYFSISWQPVAKPLEQAKYTCRHGMSYTVYECEYDGIKATQKLSVPIGDAVELWDVTLENESDKVKDLSVFSYAEFSFHHIMIDNQNFQMSMYCAGSSYEDGVIEHDLFYEEFGYQYFTADFEPDGYDCLRDKFLGLYRTEDNPAAVERGQCFGSSELGNNHCASLQKNITLLPGEKRRMLFLLGEGDRKAGKQMREKYRDFGKVDEAYQALHDFWQDKFDRLQIQTPNEGMNTMINTWNLYQSEVNIMFSRFASFIEVGGRTGLGYRDTAQDAMTIPHSNPEMCKKRIVQLLKGLVSDGYGLHLFSPEWFEESKESKPFKSPTVVPSFQKKDMIHGLEDACSDDALWLVGAVTEYVKETGEIEFLEEKVSYADKGEDTVYGHLKAILDFSAEQVGESGICKGLRADWNDCLNLGGGESAMVSFLHVWALENFLELARYLGRGEDVQKYTASIILPQVAGNLSFAIIVLTGYIRGLPIELEEAAFLEGCGPVRIFFKVIVPLTKPSFATVAIFSFLWSYNDLFTQMFFLRRPETRAITRLLNELTSNEGTDYGLMAAAVSLVVVPVLIVYIFLQKYIIKGMTAGAVKG